MDMKRLLPLTLAIIVGGLAALAANILLIDYASGGDDPVGKLRPRASLTASDALPSTTEANTTSENSTTTEATTTESSATTEPTTTDDDDSGQSGGSGSDGPDDD